MQSLRNSPPETKKISNPSIDRTDRNILGLQRLQRGGKTRLKEEGKEWTYRPLLPAAEAQALWDFFLGFQERRIGTQPYSNTRPEFEFFAHWR